MRIKKARNGEATQQPPKKKNPYLIDQYGDTLRVGTKKYADEEKRRKDYGDWLMKESPKAAPKKKMKTGGKLTTAKGGKQMLKRADGSTSQRGLWDNIRAAAKKNKAAGKPGKKPTAAMLKQEKKIKAKSK
jgi:hypothetical protein